MLGVGLLVQVCDCWCWHQHWLWSWLWSVLVIVIVIVALVVVDISKKAEKALTLQQQHQTKKTYWTCKICHMRCEKYHRSCRKCQGGCQEGELLGDKQEVEVLWQQWARTGRVNTIEGEAALGEGLWCNICTFIVDFTMSNPPHHHTQLIMPSLFTCTRRKGTIWFGQM